MALVMQKRVAKQLKSYREKHGLTQAELALEISGHSHHSLSRITLLRAESARRVGIKNYHRMREFLRGKGYTK